MPGSNIGRSSDSPWKPGQYFRCNSMNSVAISIASAFESVFRIAQPPMTSLVSENGPSVTVILPLASRTRTPSLLGSRPPVSTRVPFLSDFSTNLPIASIKAGGGGDSRYDSEWRMNVRNFMAPPRGRIMRRTRQGRIDMPEICFSAAVVLACQPHPARLRLVARDRQRCWRSGELHLLAVLQRHASLSSRAPRKTASRSASSAAPARTLGGWRADPPLRTSPPPVLPLAPPPAPPAP